MYRWVRFTSLNCWRGWVKTPQHHGTFISLVNNVFCVVLGVAWPTRRTVLSCDFPRRSRVVQVPRALGGQQGRVLWQGASPASLNLFRIQLLSRAPHSSYPSLGSQGTHRIVSDRYWKLSFTFYSYHILPDSVDIYAILCCGRGCIRESLIRENGVRFYRDKDPRFSCLPTWPTPC